MQPVRETIHNDPGSSLRCFRREEPGFAFQWHRHAEWELTWIERGRGTRFVGTDIAAYAADDLVLIGPEVAHTWYAPVSPQEQAATVIQFAGGSVLHLLDELPEGRTLHDLWQRAAGGLAFERRTARAAAPLLHDLHRCSPLERLTRLLAVLGHCARASHVRVLDHSQVRTPAAAVERIARACRHVVANLPEPIAQREVAAVAGMHPAAFARLFKRSTGRTLTEYVHHLRITRACQLLRDSDRTVGDIAFAVGFGNLANFNRVFKRLVGRSPRVYRRAYPAGAD